MILWTIVFTKKVSFMQFLQELSQLYMVLSTIVFTSYGINQTYYCELLCSLDNIIQIILMAPTPTRHSTLNYCIHNTISFTPFYRVCQPDMVHWTIVFTLQYHLRHSNGCANQTWYIELLYSLYNIIYAILMAPTPTGQDLVNYLFDRQYCNYKQLCWYHCSSFMLHVTMNFCFH